MEFCQTCHKQFLWSCLPSFLVARQHKPLHRSLAWRHRQWPVFRSGRWFQETGDIFWKDRFPLSQAMKFWEILSDGGDGHSNLTRFIDEASSAGKRVNNVPFLKADCHKLLWVILMCLYKNPKTLHPYSCWHPDPCLERHDVLSSLEFKVGRTPSDSWWTSPFKIVNSKRNKVVQDLAITQI